VTFHSAAVSETPAPDVLIPETVKRGEIELGRFEITRVQFAAFDKDYKVEPGTENYPANGITFDQATAYCRWLAQLTSETYRLPNESEVAALYKDRAGENTLDYWAGYALNPDDAAKLETEIKELPGDAPLLREVGNFSGQGDKDEELIFDLGGNVAEWVVSVGGPPKTAGASADRPADARAQYSQAAPAYTGFRVVHIPAPAVPAAKPAPAAPAKADRPARTNRARKPKPQPAPKAEEPAAPAVAPEPEKPTAPEVTPKPDDSATPPAPAPQNQTAPGSEPAPESEKPAAPAPDATSKPDDPGVRPAPAPPDQNPPSAPPPQSGDAPMPAPPAPETPQTSNPQ
jgi:hypothetical protein